MRRELDLVVISDVHLGTYGCHAKELLAYLKSIRPKCVVINGDFIDAWQFRKKYFPNAHMQVIHEILKLSMEGSRVYYLTGNHDDVLRKFSDFTLGRISLRDKLLLQLNNKQYWIFHGDVFDYSVLVSPTLATLGGKGYDTLIRLNRWINKIRMRLGKPRMSFAHRVKQRVKKAVKFINDFEQIAIQQAARQDYDAVICGHIHIPQIKEMTVDGKKVTYMNAGDWVENLTALEFHAGEWNIFRYNDADFDLKNPKLTVPKKGRTPSKTDGSEIRTTSLVSFLSGLFRSAS